MSQEYETELTQEQIAVTIAHEIKNPLALIRATLQYVELGDTQHVYRQKYELIYREIDRLSDLIKSYMETTLYKRLCIENFKIQTLINEIELLFREAVKIANIRLCVVDLETDIEFEGDYNKIKQVLINIVTNAVEALNGIDNGEIVLSSKKDSGNVVITITDNGCGIKEEYINTIGAPFFTTKEEGTGLGVLISNEIIKMHNGELTINAEENKGTIVTISLPIRI